MTDHTSTFSFSKLMDCPLPLPLPTLTVAVEVGAAQRGPFLSAGRDRGFAVDDGRGRHSRVRGAASPPPGSPGVPVGNHGERGCLPRGQGEDAAAAGPRPLWEGGNPAELGSAPRSQCPAVAGLKRDGAHRLDGEVPARRPPDIRSSERKQLLPD